MEIGNNVFDIKDIDQFVEWKTKRDHLKSLKFDPLGDGISCIRYVDHMGDDFGVVESARASRTDPDDVVWRGDDDVKLIKHMIKERHTVPFEHNAVKLFVVAPMPIAMQWLRHRIASYSMLSRRYTSKDIEFYIPKVWRFQATKNKQSSEGTLPEDWHSTIQWQEKYEASTDIATHYFEQATEELHVANEQARFILPQGVYARFYVTANLHSWMNFYDLREDRHAQEEIRLYTTGLDAILSSIFPISWKLYKKQRKERKFLEAVMSVEYDEFDRAYVMTNNLTQEKFFISEEEYLSLINGGK